MRPSFSSSVKSVFSAFYDAIFPPLCVNCKERCSTKIFCPTCWELCSAPDPIDRCPHCFTESEGLCRTCKKNPHISFTQAQVFEETDAAFHLSKMDSDTVAAFAIYAWVNLDWPIPDLVIPMPGSKEVALRFAEMIERPLASFDIEAMDEEQTLLVFNCGSPLEEVERAVKSLALASPKRGYVLSLFCPR